MENGHPGRVQDYTTANLVLIFVNLLWIFGVLWSQWGIGAVVIAGILLNHGITRIDDYRRRKAIQWVPPQERV